MLAAWTSVRRRGRGDFLTYPFAPGSFYVITSVAALHHMDARALWPG
jgi:hypothetical protein